MKNLRLVLKDRVSAGAIAALVAFLFLLQGLVGGVAQGAMAGVAVDPFNVLCLSHGGAYQQSPGGGPVKADHGLCATLCQLAANVTPVLPGRVAEIVHAANDAIATTHFGAKNAPRAVSRSVLPEARAPPFISA